MATEEPGPGRMKKKLLDAATKAKAKVSKGAAAARAKVDEERRKYEGADQEGKKKLLIVWGVVGVAALIGLFLVYQFMFGGSGLTLDNFNDIENGMSRDEVVDLLGDPDDARSASGVEVCYWGATEKEAKEAKRNKERIEAASVSFCGGKVVGKSWFASE